MSEVVVEASADELCGVGVVVTGQFVVQGRSEVKTPASSLTGKTGGWVPMAGLGVTAKASGLTTLEMMWRMPLAMRMSGCTICAELMYLLFPSENTRKGSV